MSWDRNLPALLSEVKGVLFNAMRTNEPKIKPDIFLWVLVAIIFISSPAGALEDLLRSQEEGKAVVYLNGPSKSPVDLTIILSGIKGTREDGSQVTLVGSPRTLKSLEVVNEQILLDEREVLQGKYTGLILNISGARLKSEGSEIGLVVPEEGMKVPFDFEIDSGEVVPVFLNWNVEGSVEKDYFLKPAFQAETKAPGEPAFRCQYEIQ